MLEKILQLRTNNQRSISYLREIILKSKERWQSNAHPIKIFQNTPYKKYENRKINPLSNPYTPHPLLNKRYESRCTLSSPKKPLKKYEDDQWDIDHIRRNGGL